MRSAWLAIAFVLALSASSVGWMPPAAAQPAAPRPHIVYILSDDHGWKDVGVHGSDIKTPSIDQLAQSGARFEQFYAQPMCTPSRAALLTGHYLNLAEDPAEKTNLAGSNPQKVAELQQRIEALAREAVPPLILRAALGAVKPVRFGSVALPGEEQDLEKQP